MNTRPLTASLLALAVLASSAAVPAPAAAEVPEGARTLARELLAAGAGACAGLLADRCADMGADLVQALIDAGSERRRTNDLAGALFAFELAKDVADRGSLAREGATARREAAHVLSVFGRYAESRAYVEDARRTHQRLGDVGQEARSIANLGILARYTGDLDAALGHYADARSRAESLGDERLIAVTLNNTGVIHISRGDLRSAVRALEDGLARRSGEEADQLTADLLGNLGSVHFSQGNLELALDYLRRSIAVQERLGNDFGAIHERVESGGVLTVMGRSAEARATLELSAGQAERAGAWHHAALARSYLARLLLEGNDAPAAEQEAQRAVARARSATADGLVRTLCLQARVLLRNGRADAALQVAEEALALAERMDSDRHRADAWEARGASLAALGREAEAVEAFERSIGAIEALRHLVAGAEAERQSFLERRTSSYEGLMRVHARRGRAEEALAQAERARARTLVEALHGGRTRLDTLLTPQERERQGLLREALARAAARVRQEEGASTADPAPLGSAREALRDARRQYEAFRSGVHASHPELRARSGETSAWTLAETRALLDPKTLALSYAVTDDETYLFALARAGPVRLATLPLGRRALEEQTRQFREALAERELGVRAQARQLCAALLGPVQRDLPGYDRLLVVPDGPLWELPFQALECRPGRYVLEEHAVAYAPSLTALGEMSRRRPVVRRRLGCWRWVTRWWTRASGSRSPPSTAGPRWVRCRRRPPRSGPWADSMARVASSTSARTPASSG